MNRHFSYCDQFVTNWGQNRSKMMARDETVKSRKSAPVLDLRDFSRSREKSLLVQPLRHLSIEFCIINQNRLLCQFAYVLSLRGKLFSSLKPLLNPGLKVILGLFTSVKNRATVLGLPILMGCRTL